jgi:hypothetical protein
MHLYKHRDYRHYYDSQIAENKRKRKHVWVSREELEAVSTHINENIPGASFGICHGVRNAHEVNIFRKLLRIEVIGTDISPAVNEFPYCLEWDFHNIKKEWVGSVDFIYSNSLDHSYDPTTCLSQWLKCLTEFGICYVQWARGGNSEQPPNPADCFKASKFEFIEFLNERCEIITEFPATPDKNTVFAIERKD